jgi:hypothetical protein
MGKAIPSICLLLILTFRLIPVALLLIIWRKATILQGYIDRFSALFYFYVIEMQFQAMSRKIIGFYHPTNTASAVVADQLFIEIGIKQIVFLTKNSVSKIPQALEIFELDTNTIESHDFIEDIKVDSKILNSYYQETNCFYNLEEALLMPEEKFSQSAAEDYLALIYGNVNNHLIKYDKLTTNGSMVNAYRVQKSMHEWIGQHFVLYKPHHIYSTIVNDIFSGVQRDNHFMKIQFYSHHFIVACVKDAKLQLIQSFPYQTEADIQYHILGILNQMGFDPAHSILEVSGKYDSSLPLHQQLLKLFSSIRFDTILETDFIEQAQSNYPLHHFTPFYKLAL